MTIVTINRAGRKRKSTVVRRPDGKSLGEKFDPEFFARQPHRRSTPEPISRAAGSPLGRLRLVNLITPYQHSSGDKYASLCRSYARQMGITAPVARSGALTEMISTGFYPWAVEELSTEEQQKRIAETRQLYDDCHCALDHLGREHRRDKRILKIMNEVCVFEYEWVMSDDDLGNLRLGLNCVGKLLISDAAR